MSSSTPHEPSSRENPVNESISPQQMPAAPLVQAVDAVNPDPGSTQTYVVGNISSGALIAGRYSLVERLGEGGMGEVWAARQTDPVKRKVALKLIKAGMDSKSVVQRFEQERQALALMDHPHIAKVFDGGITDELRPFFVMELVNGLPLTRFCDQARIGIRERLELFVSICQAVQHAHQKGVVHRDLKPSNILVTVIDGRPIPKVIDFGVAKAMSGKLTDQTLSTHFGGIVGTFEYMAPEQAGFSGPDVDTRADIYSLGVILYELLTGLKPFDSQRMRQAALDELFRMIREEEPSKPSTRLSTDQALPSLAAVRQIDAARLTKLLRGDLDWVVMKCIEKSRDRRYETANALSRDLQRYLANEPVEARPPSAGYRLRKLLSRNKGRVLAVALVFLALVAGVVGTTLGLFEARKQEALAIAAQRDEAQRAAAEARERRRAVAAEADALAQKAIAEANAAEALTQKKNAELSAAQALLKEQEAQDKLELSNAVVEFLGNDLLGQAGSFAQANRKFQPDYNLTIKEALDRAAGAVGSRFQNRPKLEAGIRHTVGLAYCEVGQFDKAIPQLEQSAEIFRREFGPDQAETLAALCTLARAYNDAGRNADSIKFYEQVRDMRVKTLGSDHPDTVNTLAGLAMVYLPAGRIPEAVELLERSRDFFTRKFGRDNLTTLTVLHNLAVAYRIAGRAKEAVPLHEQVRDARVRILGPDHPQTLLAASTLAVAYAEIGNPGDAIALLERVRDAEVKLLGPDHPGTLSTLDNLAATYTAAGRTAEAIALLQQVREAIERRLGTDHPDTLTVLNNLAAAHWKAKQLGKSIPLFEHVLVVQRSKYGDEHPDTLRTIANLGVNYSDAGRFDDAIPLLLQAYRERARPGLAWVSDALLMAYIRAGKNEEGALLTRDILAAARLTVPPDSPALRDVLLKYGSAFAGLKAWLDAEPVLRECQSISERREPDAWVTFTVRSWLGEVLVGQQRFADAEPLLLSGYEGLKQRSGQQPPQPKSRRIDALRRLVQLYEATHEAEKAATWRREIENLQ